MNQIIFCTLLFVTFAIFPGDAKAYGGHLRDGFGDDYELSTRSAEWAKALSDCITLYGENASLVNLETPEELAMFKDYVDEDLTADSYWIGGRWNTTDKAYYWATGEKFRDHIVVEPYNNPTRLTILALILDNNAEITFKPFEGQSKTFRYICETQNNDEHPPPPLCPCP